MPIAVLVEVALQPCGWLASYVGCAVHEKGEVFFRNLDGKGTIHRPLLATDGTVRVKSTLTTLSKAGGATLVSFAVQCTVRGEPVYDLTTTFGFFPGAALAGQAGLSATDEERALAARRGGAESRGARAAGARCPRTPPSWGRPFTCLSRSIGPPLSAGHCSLAGVEGFEPPNGGIKTRCLTTWRHPSSRCGVPVCRRGSSLPPRQKGRYCADGGIVCQFRELARERSQAPAPPRPAKGPGPEPRCARRQPQTRRPRTGRRRYR